MSESPFVNQLGDALEEAFAAERARKPRRRFWLGRPRLLVAFAVVAIGCGAAAASTLLNSSTLAIHPVECVAKTTVVNGQIAFPENDRSSPVQICAKALNVPAAKLIACAGGHYAYVTVLYASGTDQCSRLGLQPLPTSYRAAQNKVERLSRQLFALQASAYCIPPRTFTAKAHQILQRLGFRGWQVLAGATVEEEAHVIGGGDCAQLPGAAYPSFRPNIMDALDPDHQLLTFDLGPPPTLTRLVQTLAVSIERRSASRCWSDNGLKATVTRRLGAHQLAAAYAFTVEPPGEDLDEGEMLGYGGQARYEHGCPVVGLLRTAAHNLRVVDVLIYQRGTAPAPIYGLPPQRAFH